MELFRLHDRTFTFLEDQIVNKWFWHMASFNPSSGASLYKSRLGQGLHVLRSNDLNGYLSTPVLTGAPVVASSGGSIPANLDPNAKSTLLGVTAFNESGGETVGSLAHIILVHVTTLLDRR